MNYDKILVIGAGGTGSILLPQLTRYLMSQSFEGDLIIADGDLYDQGNSDRQSFNPDFVGMNKAEYQELVCKSIAPGLNIEHVPNYLSKEDIQSLMAEKIMVINCVDNNAARKYVEDKVTQLNDAVHICCGNELKTGQVQVHLRHKGESLTPTVYKRSPNFQEGQDDRAEMSCQDIAELPSGGQLIAANMMCACLALNFVIQLIGGAPMHKNGTYIPYACVLFDIYSNKFSSVDANTQSFDEFLSQ